MHADAVLEGAAPFFGADDEEVASLPEPNVDLHLASEVAQMRMLPA